MKCNSSDGYMIWAFIRIIITCDSIGVKNELVSGTKYGTFGYLW